MSQMEGSAAAVRHPRGRRASRLQGGAGRRACRPQACRRTSCRLPAGKHAPQPEAPGGPRQGDVAGLKGDVARALRALGEAPAGAGSAVAALAELERVKARMEAACSTLKAPPAASQKPPPAAPSAPGAPARRPRCTWGSSSVVAGCHPTSWPPRCSSPLAGSGVRHCPPQAHGRTRPWRPAHGRARARRPDGVAPF